MVTNRDDDLARINSCREAHGRPPIGSDASDHDIELHLQRIDKAAALDQDPWAGDSAQPGRATVEEVTHWLGLLVASAELDAARR